MFLLVAGSKKYTVSFSTNEIGSWASVIPNEKPPFHHVEGSFESVQNTVPSTSYETSNSSCTGDVRG